MWGPNWLTCGMQVLPRSLNILWLIHLKPVFFGAGPPYASILGVDPPYASILGVDPPYASILGLTHPMPVFLGLIHLMPVFFGYDLPYASIL
jgi:hypothetical protein